MGLAAADITTPLSSGPTTNVPVGKDVFMKAFAVARTDTTGTLKCVLPADATILDFLITGAASNAGTTATISLGSTTTATEWLTATDVRTAGGAVRPTTTYVNTALPNLINFPATTDVKIFAKYTETGGASSAGSWIILVYYVR